MKLSSKDRRRIAAGLSALRSHRPGALVASHTAIHGGLDDRTSVLFVFNSLEQAVEDAIATFFVGNVTQLVDRILIGGGHSEPVISGFYSKAWLAHALGVFGPLTLEDLNSIRAIRNTFAHTALPLSFDMPAIKAACVFSLLDRLPEQSDIRRKMPLAPKELYIEVGTCLCGAISSWAHLKSSRNPFFSQEQIEAMTAFHQQILQ